ncbi:MAG: YeiH family protein [Planctomycetota bacterium]|jgi:uncharacterized integral membrane protein (TIGR00698 family)|nr:YeiH family protein [Planctomycetota bacterium]
METRTSLSAIGAKMPGIALCFALAVPAWLVGKAVPVMGGPVLGILFGMLLASWKRPKTLDAGISLAAKKVLQYSIVLLGFDMNLFNALQTGRQTLVLMLFTFAAAFAGAFLFGRLLKVGRNANILIGVGTAVCGGSAIAAAAPVINADDKDVASAISTIFLFNVVAAFLFPVLGHLFHMGDFTFGLWTGTAVNDTSSVVAAGYSFSDAAGDLAVVVKLTRTLTIVPITLALALYMSRKNAAASAKGGGFGKALPWFVVGFVVASGLGTFSAVPGALSRDLAQAGKFAICAAMAAIGLNANIMQLVRNGMRPLLLGFSCWAILALTSLGVQHLLWG